MSYDAIIIGGGAAGLFCAINAGRRRKRVLVIEHNAEVGRKIVISGGGRCNFTNLGTTHENFISQNPHFCKSALSRFSPYDFVSLVRKHNIPYFEKKLGQLFCRETSRQIVEMLIRECRTARVEIKTSCTVISVAKNEGFRVGTNQGSFDCRELVIACGGLSFPKIGATDLGYKIARQFGLKIVDTRPSLVALVTEGTGYKELSGVSIDAQVSTPKQSFRENVLFTHRGMSGPAILQISNYWRKGEPVSIDLVPDRDIGEFLAEHRSDRQRLGNFLAAFLPQRVADEIARREFSDKPLYQMNDREIERLAGLLSEWQVSFRETEGYGRAEVTIGGVSTAELSSKTMESKRVPGLYFIGEVVDVTGWLGGYNFQWAWASGFAAAAALK